MLRASLRFVVHLRTILQSEITFQDALFIAPGDEKIVDTIREVFTVIFVYRVLLIIPAVLGHWG
jgi:hypothetical protein